MEKINRTIDFLTAGIPDIFAELQENDKIAQLMDELKNGGFIDKNTRIEDFRVLFGIPLREKDSPFIPIRWINNVQLLRFFLYSIFPHENIVGYIRFIAARLFVNRYKRMFVLPNSDKGRLNDKDFENLSELINKFKMRSQQWTKND